MYRVVYNRALDLWLVINSDTKLAQSSWSDRLDALCTARDLNMRKGK